ncbi:MAG: type II toxin-antitoxin system RelE/ParE family toxin [Cyclobacteriaceae bacterium]|nr:type II toxin-antitoxin system RelE/ParE family toxin [Cyclobacteriaceae bacterium]
MVVVWSKRARAALRKVHEYIAQESPKNAARVINEIIDTTLELPENPEKYPPDKYKKENDGKWRALEMYHYRVSYRIMPAEIRIVRLRHTSRTPLTY